MAALRAKYDGVGEPFTRREFDQLLGNCQAVFDVPAICFAEELIQMYPEAKVVLNVREFEEWERYVPYYPNPLFIVSWARLMDGMVW